MCGQRQGTMGACYGAMCTEEGGARHCSLGLHCRMGIVPASGHTHFISMLGIYLPFVRYRLGQVRGSGAPNDGPVLFGRSFLLIPWKKWLPGWRLFREQNIDYFLFPRVTGRMGTCYTHDDHFVTTMKRIKLDYSRRSPGSQ